MNLTCYRLCSQFFLLMKTLFLVSAAPDAPVVFTQRMLALASKLEALLPATSKPAEADVLVAVIDHLSLSLMQTIAARCASARHLRVFYPHGQELSRMVVDEIGNARARHFHTIGVSPNSEEVVRGYVTLPDPIPYFGDAEIVGSVQAFLLRVTRKPEEVVRSVC